MELTNDECALVDEMIDFAEEHWVAFLQRQEDRGYTEAETEVKLQMIKEKIHG